MDEMNKKLIEDLLLTKAMSDLATKENRFDCLNDVIDEVLADGAIDRDLYLHSIMELTQLGYVKSDIESEDDIEMSEAVGYDIVGLTPKGVEYVNDILKEPTLGEKAKHFFKEFDNVCGKLANSGVVNLAGTCLLPLLGSFK